MSGPAARGRLWHWLLYLALSGLVLFLQLLPINLAPDRLPGPDWLVALAFAWVLRRPDFMPAPLFAAVMLIQDLLFLRPPGLWALISLAGLEFLRGRARFSRTLPFVFEWLMFSGVFLAMLLANRLVLTIFLVGQPSLALDGFLLIATAAAYPLLVAISTFLLGVHKPAPGSLDELGHQT